MAKSLPVTDASIKIGPLSVNMDEVLAESVTQCRLKKDSFSRAKIKKYRTKSVAH